MFKGQSFWVRAHVTTSQDVKCFFYDRLKKGRSFIPDYYHILFEMESATTTSGLPVQYQYNSVEFPRFTGRGYLSFGESQVRLMFDNSFTAQCLCLLKTQPEKSKILYQTRKPFKNRSQLGHFCTSLYYRRFHMK